MSATPALDVDELGRTVGEGVLALPVEERAALVRRVLESIRANAGDDRELMPVADLLAEVDPREATRVQELLDLVLDLVRARAGRSAEGAPAGDRSWRPTSQDWRR